MFSPGVIILWLGTHASIPSGWERATELDGRYPKGQGSQNPDTTGGSSTHTHSSPTHTHSLNAHTHTYTLSEALATTNTGATGGSCPCLACEHYHTGSSGAAAGGTTSATAVTYAAVSNDPPYYGVIFIRSTTYNFFVPEEATILWDDESDVPDGLGFHNGTAASPDLRNKYLKGASTSQDAGQTGGSLTNVHDISHTHTAQTHTHAAATSSTALGYCYREGGCTAVNAVQDNHTHQVSLDSGTEPISSYTGSLNTTETVEPAFRKLIPLKNVSGDPLLAQVGMIALWLDDTDDIPVGWSLYSEQNDLYLKAVNSLPEVGDTGGANTHTHASQSHNHSSSGGHSHSSATISAHVATSSTQNAGSVYDNPTHQHTLASSSTETPGYTSSSTSANSSSNEPLYTTACYIKLDFLAGGAMMMLL